MPLNWVDLLLIAVVAFSVYAGWRRGFILSVLDLVRWIGSWLSALLLYRYVDLALANATDWTETWRLPISFVAVLLTASFLIHYLGRLLLRRVRRDAHEHRANRAFGILPGLLSGIVMAALVSALFFSMPISDGFNESVEQSALADRFAAQTSQLEAALTPIFEPALRQTLERFRTVPQGSNEYYELPFKVGNTVPMPDLEARMLEMVNREREAAGLKPLKPDPELTEVARQHSADMFARGYFSHYTPEGKDPFDRMREAGVKFRVAGENLALAPTLEIAHTGLMNSPGHRANILHKSFGRLGIGIMKGGRRGLMVSQEFRE
jgi:uncharacterized protein YkwD